MPPAPSRQSVVCPSCGAGNIPGSDLCEGCMSDLANLDLPETFHAASDSDLLRPISEARLSTPTTVAPGVSLRDAVDILAGDPNGAVVVVEGDRVVGILTERDVLQQLAGRASEMSRPVREVMTADPVILRDDDTMAVALNKMGGGGFRHLPLTQEGRLVALVTANDVMNWVMGRFFDES